MELFDVLLVGAFDALLLGESSLRYIFDLKRALFGLPSRVLLIKTTRVHGVLHILLSTSIVLRSNTSYLRTHIS